MRKIVHLPDSSFYSELISALDFDDDTLIYNELTDEMFRFVLPIDVNQTFEVWKDNLPKYSYQHFGNMVPSVGFGDLSLSYSLYDTDAIFGSELSSYFMFDVKVYWQKKIGGSGNDYGRSIAVDGSGNVYLNGYQYSDDYSINDYVVIKIDSDGNILWQKKIGGINSDIGYAVAVDGSGNVYVTGYQGSDVYGGTYDYGVIKLDTNGNIIWQKKIGGTGDDYGRGIAVDGSGNVYINGSQSSDDYGSNDYGVIKLDTNGNIIWQKKIGGTGDDYGWAIAVDGVGNVYLNGYQASDVYGGTYDYGVIKLDSSGNLLWQKKIGGSSNDYGKAIAVDGSGNVYLNGNQASDVYGGTYDYGVIKLDPNGNILWQKKIGGVSTDNGYAIAVDGSGNVYLNGIQGSDVYGGTYDYGVIKLDTNGNIIWQKKIGGTGDDKGYAIAVDGSGNVYLNGQQVSDSYGDYDYGVMKLYTDQESDMNLSIGDMSLSTGNMNLSIGTMNLSIGDMNLSIGDMNLSIGDIDMSGEVGGLVYLG